MSQYKMFTTKGIALTVCFAALYAVLSFVPISQIIGLVGKTITVATIIATVIGVLLGPYLAVLSTVLGGTIGLFFSPVFSPPSFVSGSAAALCAGLLATKKRNYCILVYLIFILFFGLYPTVGPVWLYPSMMWFQIVGLAILVSPLQSVASKNLAAKNNAKLLFAFFVTSLTSTLAGQIAGSLAFEVVYWPTIISDVGFWSTYWQTLTFVYPLERIIIASIATLVGASLYRILRSANFSVVFNGLNRQEKCS